MSSNDLIYDIDQLIDISRYFIYDSDKDYKKAISKLEKLKELIEKGKTDKFLKNGCELEDDP